MNVQPWQTVAAENILARRAALFRETPAQFAQRIVLGTAWALKPPRLQTLPALGQLWLRDLVAPSDELPEAERDLGNGLSGIARDLSPKTLAAATARGLYPFCHCGPMKWWSPERRALLFFADFHIAKRMRGYIRSGRYRVTFDRDFEGVITACAAPRPGKLSLTWITPRIMRAYAEAFDAGLVHSFEVTNEQGALVGGGYGVALGGTFVIESQFSRDPSASKVGFATLAYHLDRWGFAFADNKRMTQPAQDVGFCEFSRADFLRMLGEAVQRTGKSGRWQIEFGPETVANWQPKAAPIGACGH